MKLIGKPNPTEAFGWPGIEARGTHGGNDGVRTAYAASSRVWFTFWSGIITEVYYPTVDRPQLRDLQYLITDGQSFFHDEKRDLESKLERLSDHVLGYRCTNSDPAGRYSIVKEIIADPHLACVLQQTVKDTPSSTTTLGVDFVDIPILSAQQAPIHFTFFWTADDRWEGHDYTVSVK